MGMRPLFLVLLFLLVLPVSAVELGVIVPERLNESEVHWFRQYHYRVVVTISVWNLSEIHEGRSCLTTLKFTQPVAYRVFDNQMLCVPQSSISSSDNSTGKLEFDIIFTAANKTVYLSGYFSDFIRQTEILSLPAEVGDFSSVVLPQPRDASGFSIVSISVQLVERLEWDRLMLRLRITGRYNFAEKNCRSYRFLPSVGVEYGGQFHGVELGFLTAENSKCLTGEGKLEGSFFGWLNVTKDLRVITVWVFMILGSIEHTRSLGVTMEKVRLMVTGNVAFLLTSGRMMGLIVWVCGLFVALPLFRRLVRRRFRQIVLDPWFDGN